MAHTAPRGTAGAAAVPVVSALTSRRVVRGHSVVAAGPGYARVHAAADDADIECDDSFDRSAKAKTYDRGDSMAAAAAASTASPESQSVSCSTDSDGGEAPSAGAKLGSSDDVMKSTRVAGATDSDYDSDPAPVVLGASDDGPPTRPATPLPKAALLTLLVIVVADAIAWTQVFPYLPFMVQWLGLTDDESRVGEFAGYVASTYALAQLFSSIYWGRMSDHVGRRPVLLLGLAGTICTTLLFGMATTFPMALLSRALWGLCNANIGIVKSMVGELTDSSNRAKGFSLVGFSASIGRIVGPAFGGFLAQPAKHFPDTFAADGLFGVYPFLLPSLASGSLSALAVVLGWFTLRETRPATSSLANAVLCGYGDACVSRIRCKRGRRAQRGGAYAVVGDDVDGSPKPGEVDDDAVGVEMTAASTRREGGTDGHGAGAAAIVSAAAGCDEASAADEREPKSMMQLIRTRHAVVPCLMYAALGLTTAALLEGWTVWSVVTPDHGGLSFTSSDIGVTNAAAGGAMVVFQLGVYHRLANRFGARVCFSAGLLISIPIMLAMSILDRVAEQSHTSALAAAVVLNSLYMCSILAPYTAVFTLITESVAPENLGAVNGLGQSLVAGMRALGPVTGSVMVAWSFNNGGLPAPFDSHWLFVFCSLLSLVPVSLHLCCLPKTPAPGAR